MALLNDQLNAQYAQPLRANAGMERAGTADREERNPDAQPLNRTAAPAAAPQNDGALRPPSGATPPAANTQARPAQPAMAQPAPQQPQQTFAQMQQQGMARPAPQAVAAPASAPQAQPQAQPAVAQPGGDVESMLRQQVMDLMRQPNAYTSDVANQTFERLRGNLTRQFDTRRRETDERMAARGLYGSTIDFDANRALEREQATAEADLVGQIQERAALADSEARARAIQAAMGLRGQDIGVSQFERTAGQRDRELNLSEADARNRWAESAADRELRRMLGMEDVNLRREDLALNRERFADDRTWRERQFDYTRERDRVGDSRWQDERDYTRGRDRIMDERYLDERDYTRGRDTREWDYRRQRDAVSDDRYRDERDYGRGRDRMMDERYFDERDYTRGRDRIGDDRWNREFDWRRRTADDDALRDWARMFGVDRFTGMGGRLPFGPPPSAPPGPGGPGGGPPPPDYGPGGGPTFFDDMPNGTYRRMY